MFAIPAVANVISMIVSCCPLLWMWKYFLCWEYSGLVQQPCLSLFFSVHPTTSCPIHEIRVRVVCDFWSILLQCSTDQSSYIVHIWWFLHTFHFLVGSFSPRTVCSTSGYPVELPLTCFFGYFPRWFLANRALDWAMKVQQFQQLQLEVF